MCAQTSHPRHSNTNRHIHLALLQICSVLIGAGLHSPATMLLNRLIRGMLPQMNRDPINQDNDDQHCEALEAHQRKNDRGKNTLKDLPIFITGSTVAVQWKDRGLWTHGVIVKPNNDKHREYYHTIWVTKIDRLIMQNSNPIHSTSIT